jgi:hypothetical protein
MIMKHSCNYLRPSTLEAINVAATDVIRRIR